jgi:hypothetical protein
MATFRGFVESVQVRDDGWVELVLQAVHAGNARQTFFIRDLDGDVKSAHRRLAQLGLVRDALARTLPVELEFQASEDHGNLVEDLTAYTRPSFEGRTGVRRIEGVVIGFTILERGPVTASSPYRDEADLASALLLTTGGNVEQVLVDLQRPDAMTAHAVVGLLREAFRTRRPVAVLVSETFRTDDARSSTNRAPGYVQTCEWITVREETLDYVFAFLERLGQRYESYETGEPGQLSHVRVLYTTAPGQTPEGDISDNGAFAPKTAEAWVHGDSPLLVRLEAALRDRLQVKLGLKDTTVHEVEIVGRLGSAARPVWLEVHRRLLPSEDAGLCDNVPTIQSPTAADFNEVPVSMSWRGQAYFNQGIWRFVIKSSAPAELHVDGKRPCCEGGESDGGNRIQQTLQCHAYLDGVHEVELHLSGRTCAQPFQLLVYRIR